MQRPLERIIVLCFISPAVHRKLYISEVPLIILQRIPVRFRYHLRIIGKHAAAESTQDESICFICCRNMQDMLCPFQMQFIQICCGYCCRCSVIGVVCIGGPAPEIRSCTADHIHCYPVLFLYPLWENFVRFNDGDPWRIDAGIRMKVTMSITVLLVITLPKPILCQCRIQR